MPQKPGSYRQPALALLVVVLFSLNGCASFNCTRYEQFVGSETDLITFSYQIAEELTAAAQPPLIVGDPQMPILVTTFVDNNDLTRTSKFGRILQEHISSRLVQLGYPVKEIKMTGQLQIEPRSGESMLSRDLSRISPSVRSQAVLVGTLSVTARTMYISSRLIHPGDSTILASTDKRLCMDDTILAMFGMRRENASDEIDEPGRPLLNSILY